MTCYNFSNDFRFKWDFFLDCKHQGCNLFDLKHDKKKMVFYFNIKKVIYSCGSWIFSNITLLEFIYLFLSQLRNVS